MTTRISFWIGLAGPVLILTSTLAGCSRSAQSHFDRGNVLLEKKDTAAAILEFRNAVEKDPRFAPAYLKLGELFLQQGNGANAISAYVRAADLMPNDAAVQLKAGSLLLVANRPQDAKGRADKALAVEAKNPEALTLRANALVGLKDLDAAAEQIQKAVALDPSANRQTNLGVIQLARGHREEAEAAFRKAVSTDPKSIDAQIALANFFFGSGRTQEAETAFTSALALDPANLAANRAMAAFSTGSGRAAEAEPYLKKAADTGTPADKLTLADYYVKLKRNGDALALLEQLSAAPQTWALARSQTAGLQYADGKKADAYHAIDEVIARQPAYSPARVFRARFLLGEAKTDQALAELQRAVQADPRNVDAHYLLGLIHRTKRDPAAASASFKEVLRLNPQASAAQLQLAEIELQRGAIDSATQLADEAVRRQPGSLEARLILARSLLARGDVDRASEVTRQLVAAAPQVGAVQEQAGRLALRKNDAPAARAAFEKALSLQPNLLNSLTALVTLDVREGKGDRARARVEERLHRTPQDSAVLLLAARTWASTSNVRKAEEFLRRAIDADASNYDAYLLLGQLYVSQKRLDEALAEYDKLATRRPEAVGPPTMAGMILQAQGKESEARQRYERLVEAQPRAAVASNNLAWIYASRNEQLDRALQLAQAAKSELPDRPDVNDTLAFVYIKRKLPSLAIPLLRLSVEKEPGNPLFHYHLGLAYSQTGDKASARRELEQALQLQPTFDGADDARNMLQSLE